MDKQQKNLPECNHGIEIAFKYYELQAFIIFMTYSTQWNSVK